MDNHLKSQLKTFIKHHPEKTKFISTDEKGDEWICYLTKTGDSWERARSGLKDTRPIVAVDMDLVLCDFYGAYYKRQKEDPGIKYPQSEYGFFENLEPMPYAIEAYNLLKEKFNVKILTAPSVKNPLCYTEKRNWVHKHLGEEEVYRLTISKDKHLFIADYLIDDTLCPEFTGRQLHFGSKEFPDWKAVLKELGIPFEEKLFTTN